MTALRAATTPPRPTGLGRSALGFILVTVLLDILALGIIVPILPGLVTHFLSGDTARAARVYGLFGTVWALMHFLCSPLSGALSDRFGRRPVILLSNVGLGLDYVLMALAPSLGWLFAGRVISGITAASIPAASAYIADTLPPEDRAHGYGLLGAAFGAGFVLGPALGGMLGGVDPRLPFWVAAGLSLLNALWGLFVLPESLPPERRSPIVWKNANPIGSLRLLRRHPLLARLGVSHFLRMLAHASLPSVFVLYAGHRYGWDTRAVGLVLTVVGVCGLVVQGGLVRPLVRLLGDRKALHGGLFCGAAAFVVYGAATTGAGFMWGVPLMSLWGVSGPVLQGLMTRHAGANEQGALQGASSSVAGIAELLGPGLFTLTFAHFIRPDVRWHLPGAPFFLAAALLLAALVPVWDIVPARAKTKAPEDAAAPEPVL
jgi:DHA1 family tetracycline resistance protein-like MFS transporter